MLEIIISFDLTILLHNKNLDIAYIKVTTT